MNKSFITSDNREIKFIEGWYESKKLWPFNIKSFTEFVDRCIVNPKSYPNTYGFFLNKLVVFNYFHNVMRECNIETKWDRVLDIGTGPAIQPRLMKMTGMCNEAYGIDIVDRQISDEAICVYLGKELQKNPIISTSNTLNSWYPLIKPKLVIQPIDHYIIADFLCCDFLFKLDCITATMCGEYFKPQFLFDKVSYLLNPEGVFFVIVDNWYEMYGASMHLSMDAPWLHARISRDSLHRYYDECRPEIAEHAHKAIGYFKQNHMTPIDYMNEGKRVGLTPVHYRRSFGYMNTKESMQIIKMLGKEFDNILRDIKIENPNACVDDLFTNYITLVFRKDV